MSSETPSEKLKTFVIEGEDDAAQETALQISKTGVDPLEVIEKYLSPAMKSVCEKFEKEEYFLDNVKKQFVQRSAKFWNCMGTYVTDVRRIVSLS